MRRFSWPFSIQKDFALLDALRPLVLRLTGKKGIMDEAPDAGQVDELGTKRNKVS